MSASNASFTGDIPRHYDTGLGPVIFAGYAAEMARRAAAGSPSRVLETACGTGIVTRALRDALPVTTHIAATDLNADMLGIAEQKFQPGGTVAFRTADGTALPFPDGSFDTVICQFGMMFYPDKDKGYREAHRVLAPGGRYLFSVWDAHRYNAFGRIAHEVIGSFFPSDPPSFYAVPFGYSALDPIKASLLEAGFAGIDISVVPRVQRGVDIAAFAQGVIFGNPVAAQIQQRGGPHPAAIRDAVAKAMRKEIGEVEQMQAIFFDARKD